MKSKAIFSLGGTMKINLMLSLVFFSRLALACPNLTGVYECQDDDGKYFASVEQSADQNGVVTYSVSGTVFAVTDEVPRQIDETDEFKNATIASSCEGDNLVNAIEGELYNDGRFAGTIDMLVTFYLGDNGDLVQMSEGEVTLPDGQGIGFGEMEWCARVQN